MARLKLESEAIAEALGAGEIVEMGPQSQGPLDLLQLRDRLSRRLRSSGGRRTDPAWTIRRVVPFKEDQWRELEGVARECSEPGRKISPSQLAAWLIEHGLSQLKKSRAV